MQSEAIEGERAEICLQLTDVLASRDLAEKFYEGLDEYDALQGRIWAQSRIHPTVNVALRWLDPRNQHQPRTLFLKLELTVHSKLKRETPIAAMSSTLDDSQLLSDP